MVAARDEKITDRRDTCLGVSAVLVSDACVAGRAVDLPAFLEHWAVGRDNEDHIRRQVAAARAELGRGTDRAAVEAALLALPGPASADALAESARRWLSSLADDSAGAPVRMLRQVLDGHRYDAARVVMMSDLAWPLRDELRAVIGAEAVLPRRPPAALLRPQSLCQYARAEGVDLTTSYAYGSVAADIPVLREVGWPVIVGHDRELSSEASRLGWARLS